MDTFLDHPEVQKLIRELVAYTGESAPEAVARALQERLEREKGEKTKTSAAQRPVQQRKERAQAALLAERILQIGRECAGLPVLDDRTNDFDHTDITSA